jgi:AcrR family transcriptional regulator
MRANAKTTYKKSETSRQHVIDAAIKTLAKRGFANTSVSDIAATAGMSKGVVHYHFTSKDDLLARVLEQCAKKMSDRVRAAWEAPRAPMDKIKAALAEMWATRTDGNAEIRVLVDLMSLAVHDPKLRKPLSLQFHAMRADMVQEFVKAFEAIGLRPKVPAHIVPKLMMATLDGLGIHQIFDPPTKGDEKEIFRALELVAFSLFEL